jgi:hypothetical protein
MLGPLALFCTVFLVRDLYTRLAYSLAPVPPLAPAPDGWSAGAGADTGPKAGRRTALGVRDLARAAAVGTRSARKARRRLGSNVGGVGAAAGKGTDGDADALVSAAQFASYPLVVPPRALGKSPPSLGPAGVESAGRAGPAPSLARGRGCSESGDGDGGGGIGGGVGGGGGSLATGSAVLGASAGHGAASEAAPRTPQMFLHRRAASDGSSEHSHDPGIAELVAMVPDALKVCAICACLCLH